MQRAESIAREVMLTLLIVSAGSMPGRGQTRDVTGWGKVKWGMTEKQVAKAIDGSGTLLPRDKQLAQLDSYVPVVGWPVEIAGTTFLPDFVFSSKTKRLTAVILRCAASNGTPISGFNALEELLLGRYGSGKLTKSERGDVAVKKESVWIFKSGSVHLVLIDWGTGIQQLYIRYEMRNREEEKL